MLIWIFALGLIMAVLGAVLASTNRRLLLYALPFLAALNGVPIKVGGQRVRYDQLAAVLLVCGLIPAIAAGRRRLRIDSVTVWLLICAGLNVMSSLVNSPVKWFSLMQLTSIGSSWALYAVLLNCLTTREDLDRFEVALLIAGIAEASFGILAFALGTFGIEIHGANVGNAFDWAAAFGAYGTLIEPNIYGSFCAAYFIFALGLNWVAGRSLTNDRFVLIWVTIVTSALGLLLSFTRGAWLGAVVGVIALAWLAARTLGQRGPLRAAAITMTAGTLIIGGVLVTPGPIGEFVRYKLVNLFNPESVNGEARLIGYTMAWLQYVKHPIIGWGTYTFLPLAVGTAKGFNTFGGSIWLGNFLLLALHDTGIIGLIAWLAMLGTALRSGTRASQALWPVDRLAGASSLAMTAAVVSLAVAFIFTTAFPFGYPWLFIGLMGAYAQYARALSRQRPIESA